MLKRRMRTIPTHKPKSFASSKIKREYYPPAIRVFTGAETPAESGDAYIQKKINDFSNLQLKPVDQLQLISLLRPAYQVKKVIDQSDFADALARLQELKSIEKAPLVLKEQLQSIQEYVKQMPDQKKKKVLEQVVNNDNPFPEFADLKMDDIKKAVMPLYSKDDIMALYGKEKNVRLFENPKNTEDDDWFKNQVDLENEIEDLKEQFFLPKPLPAEKVMQDEPMMEDPMMDEDEMEELIKQEPKNERPQEDELTSYLKELDETELENMKLKDLKWLGRKLKVDNLSKYKKNGAYPYNSYGLVSEILDKREEYLARGRLGTPERRRGRPIKDIAIPQRRANIRIIERQQDGEGIGDVFGSIIDKLTPNSVKNKIFDVLIGNRVKHFASGKWK